jgi:TRAP-type C4-dicarboxylate transport system substrate-binding protein
MKTKAVLLVVLLTAVFMASAPFEASAEVIKLRFAQITPASHPYYSQISQPWAQEIEKRTKGRVKITLYPAGALVAGNVMYKSTISGITDIGTSSFGWERGRHPVMSGYTYIPGFKSAKVAAKVANQAVAELKLKELSDTHLLFIHACAPMHMWSKTPVRTMKDLKGLEIRAAGPTGKLVKYMGGVPISATQSQAYEMLSKGIVKASISSLDVLKGFRQAEVVKYVTLAYFHVAPFFVCMNQGKWDSLPPDVQKVFTEVSREYIDIAGGVWDKASAAGLEYAKKQGLEIIELSDQERAKWHAAYAPLQEQYVKDMEAKGLPGRKFLETVKTLTKKYQ